MDQCATPEANITNLPPELLEKIFSYLIPHDYIFKLKAQHTGDNTCPKPQGRGFPSHQGVPLLSTTEHISFIPSAVLSRSNLNVQTLLLSHSTIYPHIVKLLYTKNVFYFADVLAAQHFASALSPLARSSIQRVQVDTRGPASFISHMGKDFRTWNSDIDRDVIGVPALFPSLKELRLGGIGPSIFQTRDFTYRGRSVCYNIGDRPSWDCKGIELIAEIVGIDVDADDNNDGPHKAGTESTSQREENPFADAHVLCASNVQWGTSIPQGLMQLNGTRIVRRGINFVLGSMEVEVDVAEAVRNARFIRDVPCVVY